MCIRRMAVRPHQSGLLHGKVAPEFTISAKGILRHRGTGERRSCGCETHLICAQILTTGMFLRVSSRG